MVKSFSTAPELKGVAGYATPYPYLEKLQGKMEERLARRVPAAGRFCGFCYGRLRDSDETCGVCASALAAVGTTREIPQEVLRAYQLRQKTEARWVHLGAFFGLALAMGLFLVMVLYGPGMIGHPALAFTVLIGGGYLLAQLFGALIGAQIGYSKGARKRDAAWAEILAARDRDISGRGAITA
jgi:hypothetical protein